MAIYIRKKVEYLEYPNPEATEYSKNAAISREKGNFLSTVIAPAVLFFLYIFAYTKIKNAFIPVFTMQTAAESYQILHASPGMLVKNVLLFSVVAVIILLLPFWLRISSEFVYMHCMEICYGAAAVKMCNRRQKIVCIYYFVLPLLIGSLTETIRFLILNIRFSSSWNWVIQVLLIILWMVMIVFLSIYYYRAIGNKSTYFKDA